MGRFMLRYLLIISFVIFAVVGTTAAQQTTITFWHHSNVAWVDAWSYIAAKFEEEYPHIKVQIEVLPDFGDKVLSAFAAGTEPDVIDIIGSLLLRFAKEGLIAEVPSQVMTEAELKSTFWPITLASFSWEGKNYGIPFEVNVAGTGVIFNQELLAMSGMELPAEWIESRRAGETWDELVNFANQLSIVDRRGNIIQAGLAMVNDHEHSDFLAMIFQQGGDYRDFENNRVNFETPEARAALELFIEAMEEHKLDSVDLPNRQEMFLEQTAVATIGGPWYKGVIDREVQGLDYVRLNLPPYFGDIPHFPVKGGWGLSVSKGSQHHNEAWEFVRFAMRPENMKYFNKVTQTVPSRIDFADDPDFAHEETLDVVPYGVDIGAQIVVDVDQFIWLIITPEMEAVFHGEKSIDEALKTMTDRTNEMIARIRGEN